MIYVGIDIAKHDHVIIAVAENGDKITRPMSFPNSSQGFEKCLAFLEELGEAKAVSVGMEATGHYWLACFTYLTNKDYDVFVINPMQTKAMRKLKGKSRVKTDLIDAYIIAETLRFEDYELTKLARDEVQELKYLTRFQQSLKEEIAQVKTQVICCLDQVFPEFEKQFSNTFGESARAFLDRCPTPEECIALDIRTLTSLLEKTSRGHFGREKAKALKAAARSSIGIKLGAEAVSFQIKLCVAQIDFIEGQIGEVDLRIKALLDDIEPLILTLPGISYTLGGQIVAEIGDINRFSDASSLVSYAGINPSISQSGKFEGTDNKITKQGSSYLRRAIWLGADGARRFDPKLREYYEQKRAEGKPHRVAVTAVARKLTHIIYAVLKNQQPYDPKR